MHKNVKQVNVTTVDNGCSRVFMYLRVMWVWYDKKVHVHGTFGVSSFHLKNMLHCNGFKLIKV